MKLFDANDHLRGLIGVFVYACCLLYEWVNAPPGTFQAGKSKTDLYTRKCFFVLILVYLSLAFLTGFIERPAEEALAPMPSDGAMLEALKFVKFVETPEQRRALYELLEAFPGLVAATAEWE